MDERTASFLKFIDFSLFVKWVVVMRTDRFAGEATSTPSFKTKMFRACLSGSGKRARENDLGA